MCTVTIKAQLLPLFRLAVEPIANLANCPIFTSHLLDQFFCDNIQSADLPDRVVQKRGLTNGIRKQLLAGSTGGITGLSLYKWHLLAILTCCVGHNIYVHYCALTVPCTLLRAAEAVQENPS
jgi:hypothetical protein